jgi:hypothetical protein
MAVKIPSQSEIEQFMDDIDNLEGYSFYEWLDYMEENYPNVDAIELYTSKGKNIVTGYYDGDEFIQGEPDVEEPLDADTMQLIQDSVDSREDVPLNVPASEELTQGETTAAFLADLRDRKLNPERYESIMLGRDEGEEEQFTEGAIIEGGMLTDEEIMAQDTPIAPLDPMGLGEMIVKYATDAGIDPTLAMVMAGITTKNPSKILSPKNNKMLSTKNNTILKEVDPKIGTVVPKAKVTPSNSTVSTKNSTVLKETTPKISTKNSTVLKETTPKVSTKNSTILKDKNVDVVTKKANVAKVDAITKSRKLTTKDKALAAGITTAATIAALTNQNGLTGERDSDGSLMMAQGPTSRGSKGTHTMPDGTEMKDSDMMDDMPPYEKSIDDRDIASKSTGKPGWTLDGKGGNYLSANFEDDYWNTPDGVEEAIGIWGRPVGNKIGNKY